MPSDSITPYGRWAFSWRDGGEVVVARGDYHRYLKDGEYLLFRGAQQIRDGEWIYVITIVPIVFQNDDVQVKEKEAVFIGFHNWNQLFYWFGTLPTQVIDYCYFRCSISDPFKVVQWRQYSSVEDYFLAKFIERVRRYHDKGMDYVLGPP